jgi:predicted unusual protein kinase regulating ubiquinone biosynthesis (AarF/ABC1/UbiB family)
VNYSVRGGKKVRPLAGEVAPVHYMARIHYRKRFLKGLLVALRILISYRIAAIAKIFLSPDSYADSLGRLHKRNASLIREKAIEMKGIMIKVGQFLSSRIDFLPDEYIAELSQLQDRVPPHDYAGIGQRITDSLGSPPEEIFSSFDREPIAAASLGQVHSARMKDGRQVAVKVQYPDIEKIIETDIRMFGLLIRIMRGRAGTINLRVLHEEFSKIVRAELDYLQEGKNAERFSENFKGDDRIVIPEVKWEYTTRKVLTLEFVGGIKITECDAVKSSGIDCREVVNLLAETYSRMIFVHGFFHGDPHPGNIFVREGPTLVFVDFGMVQAIPNDVRRELRRFANAIVESNTAGILEAMERMGFIIEGADYSLLTGVAQSLIDKYRDISPAELKALTVEDISKEIENIIGVIRYIQIPNNFILLGRTIGMLNGISFKLNPDVNIIEIGKPFIKEFLRGTGKEQRKEFFKAAREKVLDLWNLPARVDEFLTKANRGELSFKLSKPEIREITGQIKSLTDVMMLVVLTVTTSVIALFFIIIGAKTLPLIAAGASIILGLLSVYRLLKK